uniref:Uncharacterized protein n=1 Tax=Avena sativa TaxID=4498 RepID=A0ACD5UPK5_AVESA
MPLFLFTLTALLSLHVVPARSATTDTISAAQPLISGDKIVSTNGRYALGFFQTGSESNWYMGIWFNTVPKFTSVWVANRDNPIKQNTTSLELTISPDGNLVILDRFANTIIWSAQATTTTANHTTIAVLLNSGNLVLQSSSNSSDILWQSFDYPTDTFLPGAKFGWDKVTGLNRRLVSWKNLVDPATGVYREELDPSGVDQYLLTPLNSSVPYWSSGAWNGKYFALMPEMSSGYFVNFTFVNNDQEKYFMYSLYDESMVIRNYLDASGQTKTTVWLEGSQSWMMVYAQPKAQCDVYAACGPSTVCNENALPSCSCMKGFAVRSPQDWELEDGTGGCMRNTPLDCSNGSTGSSDKFYSMTCVRLPQNDRSMQAAASSGECEQVCLSDCSCAAYSFGDSGCFIWHHELLNVRHLQCSDDTSSADGETLHLRLAAGEFSSQQAIRSKGHIFGVIFGVTVAVLVLIAAVLVLILLVRRRNRRKCSGGTLDNQAQGGNGIAAFGYADLQRATKNFSEKLGGGSFGCVFKGSLSDSTTIAVKRLDHANQGEKQFRAEVSSIGIIHHINLVRLIGFCCEGSRRLLVYEHMPNHSLDLHLFKSSNATMPWRTRYQIALGVARGLAYLHGSCQDCIIHCDIKPENILLDASFAPKIADFGLAKLLGRDFSRVLTTVRGTAGYLAPEWISGVAVTTKVDVYSFGMVLLEIISGRRNSCGAPCSCGADYGVYFPVHAACKLLEGGPGVESLVDHMLHGDVNLDEAERACKVACWCIQDSESDRPTMREVVQILEGLAEVSVPPMPRLLQAMSATGSSHSTCL